MSCPGITVKVGWVHVDDVAGAIAALAPDAFASPNRSTIPLLDYWRDSTAGLVHLSGALGVPLQPDADLTFEYEVPVQKGRGKSSFTDLMIVSAQAAVAIEAKFREPPYEDARTWLGAPRRNNRVEVLTGWLGLIGQVTGRAVSIDAVLDLPYQLLHRTASVCAVQRQHRQVVYQVFDEARLDYYKKKLTALQNLLPRGGQLAFTILFCPAEATPRHASVADRRLPPNEVSAAVREALASGPLFSFGEPTSVAI